MKIGIISDTHDDFVFIDKAIKRFKKDKINVLLHCGDISNEETLNKLKVFKSVFVVKGNCDDKNIKEIIKTCKKNKFYFWKEYTDINIGEKKIAIIHSDDFNKFTRLVEEEKYDYVFYGHSHKEMIGKENNTFVVNPGSFESNTICIVDLEKDNIKIIELD